MAIPPLLINAFELVPAFNDQVDGAVRQYILYLNNQHPDMDAQNRNILTNVNRAISTYQFGPNIVADSTWSLTYDGWAADPAAAQGAIDGGVQAVFNFLTGYTPPPPETP
jgi:hypothetical protein